MSGYGSLRKRAEHPTPSDRDETRCAAIGCPCRGSVSLEGGRFICTAHAALPSDRWPLITERLREHDWLIGFVDEMQKMDRNPPKPGQPGWREFATQFWQETDDFCVPRPREQALPYQNRMRLELLYRCGAMAKRPEPRIPEPAKSRGNAGMLLGRRA